MMVGKLGKSLIALLIVVWVIIGVLTVVVLQHKGAVTDFGQTYFATTQNVTTRQGVTYTVSSTPIPLAKEYGSLNYNAVDLNYNVSGVSPHFICPNCGYQWIDSFKPVAVMPANYDFNGKVVFTCPNCHSTFSLFLALHNDGNGLNVCLQRSDAEGANGISVNWWKRNSG